MAGKQFLNFAFSEPYLYQEATGGNSVAIGIDNADSDKFKISVETVPGSTPAGGNQRIIIDPAGTGVDIQDELQVSSSSVNPIVIINDSVNGPLSGQLQLAKSRAGGAITTGDALGIISFIGFDGTSFTDGAQIVSASSGTIAAGRIPSNLEFYTTPDSVSSPVERMIIGTNGEVTINQADSGFTLDITGGGMTVTGGINFASLTAHGVIFTDGSSDLTASNGTNGQVIIGGGTAPTWATLTAGAGISISNGANSITISASAFSASYTNVNSTPYVVTGTDDYLSVDTSALSITIQLPNAPTTNREFTIKDRTGSAATRNITVTTVGGAVNIDGGTTFVMNSNHQAINLIFNGTSYEVF